MHFPMRISFGFETHGILGISTLLLYVLYRSMSYSNLKDTVEEQDDSANETPTDLTDSPQRERETIIIRCNYYCFVIYVRARAQKRKRSDVNRLNSVWP